MSCSFHGSLLVLAGLSAALFLPSRSARAQTVERVEVHVTMISGGNVYLDKGKSAGIRPGDLLFLYPQGSENIQATIKVVSRNNSRAALPSGAQLTVAGIRGEVLVPKERLEPNEQAIPKEPTTKKPKVQQEVPEHPPWTNPITGKSVDEPLLAPAFGEGPAGRPTRILGRVFSQTLHTWDRQVGNNRYLTARLGTSFRVENPLHVGGQLNFDGEMFRRESIISSVIDQRTTRGRIQRLSYRWAPSPDAPVHAEAGRFLQPTFPEFGLLDGVELNTQVGSINRLGLSVGTLPEPFSRSGTGNDFQTAFFYRYRSSLEEEFVSGVGYQKSWHKGSQDRDLLLWNVDSRPVQDLYVHSSLWVDYYGAGDTIKAKGLQITEYHLQGNYRLDNENGVGLSLAHIRWPELKRDEFRALTADLIRDNRVFRIGLSSWHELERGVRLDTRLDHWEDQDDDGNSGDLRLSLRDIFFPQGSVSLSVFRNEGSFTTGTGARLFTYKFTSFGSFNGSFEWARYYNQQLGRGTQDLVQMALGGGADFSLSRSLDLSLSLDYRFGDAQDAFTLGVFLQTRF